MCRVPENNYAETNTQHSAASDQWALSGVRLSTRLGTRARQKVGTGGSDCSSFIPLKLFVFRSSRTKAGRQVKRPHISAKSSVVYVGRMGLRLLINPCFAQFKPVFFGLFFGLE